MKLLFLSVGENTPKFKIEVTKFMFVGLANFVLTFVIFTVMLKFWGLYYLLSLAIAWFVGMFISYTLNFVWVFKPEEQIQFRIRFVKFFLAGLISILMNMAALVYIVENVGMDSFYAQTILIPFIVGFNFITAKFWSLRGEKK